MFSHESTDNLLDNLESELSEIIELETPKIKNQYKEEGQKTPENPPQKIIDVKVSKLQKREPPPVPVRRNIQKSPQPPTPVRRQNSLDKIDKNNENEIIQLQSLNSEHESMSSESQKNSQQSSKHSTVISVNEKKKKETKSNVRVIHETEHMPDNINETIFVIKHGKWAHEEEKQGENSKTVNEIEKEINEVQSADILHKKSSKISPSKAEKPIKKPEKKKKVVKKRKESTTTSATTSLTSSSSDSSSEETPQLKKKLKKQKFKGKANDNNKKKSKKANETATSCSEDSISKGDPERLEMISTDKAIGIYVTNIGPMKYRKELKGLRIKITFYNEDNGKQIGDALWTKNAGYNNDFYNFICSWNDNLKASFDLKRLREIYNNVLIFFEVINSDNIPVCWAFIKLFSPTSVNIDKRFKLQFFEYQYPSNSCFSSIFSKKKSSNDNYSIFEQWQMERKKISTVLNIYLKDINLSPKDDEKKANEDVKVNKIQVSCANEGAQRHWRKIPGQACKVPNNMFTKLLLHDKGTLNVKFSHDGNYLAFSEVSSNGHHLHVYKFPEMTETFVMLEHSDIIHDLDWQKQKQYNCYHLVTASADFTAIVWRIKEDAYTYSFLPHPSFVYASKFLQSNNSENIRIVTACRDNYIRIWKSRQGTDSFELSQELKHPKFNSFTYITSIVTRNADAFYSSSSTGDIIEWTLNDNKEYQFNRHFKFDEIRGRIINSMELHPRGNKICIRIQDHQNFEVTNSIYVLGIATGTLTQRFSQYNAQTESQGKLKISPCGSQVFSTNGPIIHHYQMTNGNIVTTNDEKHGLNIKYSLGEKGFISCMDYHPKDFFLVCGIYGGNPGGIVVFSYETNEKDPIEVMKSQEMIHQKTLEAQQIGCYSDIIKRLDEVFLAPIPNNSETVDILRVQEFNQEIEDKTFTINTNSRRLKTYSVSQGPATFTIQKGGTYEIQKNDGTDDDETTISESLN